MKKIIIIGTEPTCPRCQLLINVITSIIKEQGLNASVKHLAYTSEEAQNIAAKNGLTAGTAKDVATIAQMKINTQKIARVITTPAVDVNCEFYPYNDCKWSKELDELLRPFEEKAKEVGIMMTPVLVVNNEIKHQGSVPEFSKIIEWLNC